MDPKASKSSGKPQKTFENFEKLRKNFKKFAKKLTKTFFTAVTRRGILMTKSAFVDDCEKDEGGDIKSKNLAAAPKH